METPEDKAGVMTQLILGYTPENQPAMREALNNMIKSINIEDGKQVVNLLPNSPNLIQYSLNEGVVMQAFRSISKNLRTKTKEKNRAAFNIMEYNTEE